MLSKIVEKTKIRLADAKDKKSLESIKNEVRKLEISHDFPFEKALSEDSLSIIAEIKKASPSKGLIDEDFNYTEIAKEYEDAGVSAISVLTEPYYFKGDISYLNKISQIIETPLLRKDFVIDEYMIYEAKLNGASAILLIVSILDQNQIKEYIKLADELGLSALVEAHDSSEIKIAIDAGARIIGVNNRDLKTFNVDINNSIKLRHIVPENILFISESGIKTKEDIKIIKDNNINGVLIGETFMKSEDKKSLIEEFKNA